MNVIAQSAPAPDFAAIKAKQNVAWGSGDYGRIGVTLQVTGENLAEALDLDCGAKVLDVAAGNGNATLALARRFCDVTSTDYVETLLEQGRERAAAENLDVVHRVADAEDLPFGDGEFDAVVSSFGVMFTPNQEKAAAELVRVCRSGGKIGLANWTPESFIGQVFKIIGKHLPPAPGVRSPALWGDKTWIETTFGDDAKLVSFVPMNFMFRYRSPEHFVAFFREFYGPIHKAFLALDEAGRVAFNRDLIEAIGRYNTATDGSMRVPSQYAQIVLQRR